MSPRSIVLVSLIGVFGLFGAANSQPSQTLYISPGLGIGTAGGETGLAYAINVSTQQGPIVFSAHALGCRQIALFSADSRSADFALLAGLHAGTGGELATLEAGIGYATYTSEDVETDPLTYRFRRYNVSGSAVGLALQSQLFHKGIGLLLYSNLNSVQAAAGALFCLRFGTWEWISSRHCLLCADLTLHDKLAPSQPWNFWLRYQKRPWRSSEEK